MVNMPHRSSESLMAEYLSLRDWSLPRPLLLAFAAGLLLAGVIAALPADFRLLHELVPLDDPALAAIFTA